MKFSCLPLCLLLCISFLSCKTTKDSGKATSVSPYTFEFQKFDVLSEVVDMAKKDDKLIFLDVYTDWCLPCKMMDKDVFTDKKLGAFINEHFVSAKVNAEKGSGPIIADLYKVPGYPTLLFLDKDGKVLVEKSGVAYQREMYDLAEEAMALVQGSSE